MIQQYILFRSIKNNSYNEKCAYEKQCTNTVFILVVNLKSSELTNINVPKAINLSTLPVGILLSFATSPIVQHVLQKCMIHRHTSSFILLVIFFKVTIFHSKIQYKVSTSRLPIFKQIDDVFVEKDE